MSQSLFASHPFFPCAPSAGLPHPRQLAGLGAVLCLYRSGSSALGAWKHAVSVVSCQRVDSDGLHESLCFQDAQQRCCWRLYLLPDSDFLAWDRLVERIPAKTEGAIVGEGFAERLWRRMAGSLCGERWRMCALHLHVAGAGQTLAASMATLSSPAAALARRIARIEGAQGEVWLDEGCGIGQARRSGWEAQRDHGHVVRL
ncbi:MAG: Hemin transport protein [Stenotrophomonas sp.]